MQFRKPGEIVRGLSNLLYPQNCLLCDSEGSPDTELRHGLCTDCCRAITTDHFAACPRCSATIGPHTNVEGGCGECRGHSLGFHGATRLGRYEGRLREAILKLKVGSGEALGEMLGRLFYEVKGIELKALGIEVVSPVPLHWLRKWHRQYNQAEAVAREIASGLGVDFRPSILRRVKATSQHAQPSASARVANIRGAFRIGRSASLSGRTVLVVDDVMTTGSTVGEAARVLREAGASKVFVAVLARA